MIKIVDVSKYDRTVDWDECFGAHPEIAGVIGRCGIGFEGDAYFGFNYLAAKKQGLPYSPYFTFIPSYDIYMQVEYMRVILLGAGWKAEGWLIPPGPECPEGVLNRVWIDCEVYGGASAAKVKAFLDLVRGMVLANFTTPQSMDGQDVPGVYTNQSWWQASVGYATWAKNYRLWVSNPGSVVPAMPPGWDEYELFQYTWTGRLEGFDRFPKSDVSKPWGRISGHYDATVTANSLNVRTGPGTSFPSVRKLQYGDRVTVFEERLGWGRIGENEWCSTMYLAVVPG